MAAFGQPDPHYYISTDVSRDGNRVLVVGNPPLRDMQDTPDLTLDLVWPTPTPKLRDAGPWLSKRNATYEMDDGS